MSNNFTKKYVEPVLKNMDVSTRDYVWGQFYQIYRIHPDNLFRMKSVETKVCNLEHFYYFLVQMYNDPQCVNISIQSGKEQEYNSILSKMSVLPTPEINFMCVYLKHMAALCKVTSNIVMPKIPKQTFGDFVSKTIREFSGGR